jgi:predicted nucleotidyltransferase
MNPIHPEGPPLWFDSYCTSCGIIGKSLTSNLLEGAAYRAIQRGEVSEDKAGEILASLLPPKVIKDSLEVTNADTRT